MATVAKELKDGVLLVHLGGVIDEAVDLGREIGPFSGEAQFVCREISQINSYGVKGWIEYFRKLADQGGKFTFAEVPPCLVEQLNYVKGFGCGGAVISLSVPFVCLHCHRELRGVVDAGDLRRISYRLPPIKCPNCGAKADFDDEPEEYFAFLMRQAG